MIIHILAHDDSETAKKQFVDDCGFFFKDGKIEGESAQHVADEVVSRVSPGAMADKGVGSLVTRYGVLRTHSTSGELRLSYYDIKQSKVLESSNGHPWFFALPESLEHDQKLADFNDYIESHEGSVFKIAGMKDADDCGYYGNGVCLESITIKTIDAVGKVKN